MENEKKQYEVESEFEKLRLRRELDASEQLRDMERDSFSEREDVLVAKLTQITEQFAAQQREIEDLRREKEAVKGK